MKRFNGRFLGYVSPALVAIALFQVVAATWAQSAQSSSGSPKLSNAPAVATVNGRLRWPFFIYFYRFTPIADTQGGFPFQDILGAPTINSDAVIAYHAILTGGNEGVFTSKNFGDVTTLADATSTGYDVGFSFSPSINDAGQVAFLGSRQTKTGVTTTLLRAQVGTQLTALVDYPFHLDDYCGGQINGSGQVVTFATRDDGGHAIVVNGQPPLVSVIRAVGVDKANTDMDQAFVFGSLNCNFFGPSINTDQMVGFSATKTDGNAGVFTSDLEGDVTQFAGVDDVFAGFGDVVLNESGSINKTGDVLFEAELQTGSESLYLWSPSTGLTQIVNASAMNAPAIGGFAMDYQGQVAYELQYDELGDSAVFRGPGGVFGRLVGSGDVLFGRTVVSAHIVPGSLNFKDQLAVWLIFADGTSMIARGDPTIMPPYGIIPNPLPVLAMTTGRGSSVSVGTPIATPSAYLNLSFDLTFLSEGGTLDLKLGDSVIKSIPAAELGVRRRISIPIDLRKAAAQHDLASQLQFVLNGKPGLSAQISDLQIPGVLSENFQSGSLARWRIDRTGGGSASLANGSRFPLTVRIEADKSTQASAHLVSVAISSEGGLDVTKDVDRATLRLAGTEPRTTRDAAGHKVPDCEIPKPNNGMANELVCRFEIGSLPANDHDPTLTLEAATSFGWGVAGSAKVHLP
jgi:hypothetical protein